MKRDVDWREISDGKLYTSSDLVRTDTGGCKNCGSCCHGMRDTIVLDPWDLWCLGRERGWTFQKLLSEGKIELGVCDGLILPHLCMQGPEDACVFLDEQGRCKVHTCRPGFCRLYPLGRYYENRTFHYILQKGECILPNLAKIKVKKWLGIPELGRYERYITRWHYFLVDLEEMLERAQDHPSAEGEGTEGQDPRKQVCMVLLQEFYAKPWDGPEDFYEEFERRLSAAKSSLMDPAGSV